MPLQIRAPTLKGDLKKVQKCCLKDALMSEMPRPGRLKA
jgi:hypothetical protein